MAINNSTKNKFELPVWEFLYWLVAALYIFYVLSNREYDVKIRMGFSSILFAISFGNAYVLNKFLIPKLFFKGKKIAFSYLLFALVVFSLWFITLCYSFFVLYYSVIFPHKVIPTLKDVTILLLGTYLISLISSSFYFVKESFRFQIEKSDVEQQKNRLELKLKEVQLELLKEQIHPHFIFNMMNNLYALVKNDVALSREVIVRLSDLLDYMLYECNTEFVELSKEINFINNYIELEKIRHDESFNVKTNFPNAIPNFKIAPLILFPFVENAFKHGLKQTKNDFIEMQLEPTSELVIFKIKNNIQNNASLSTAAKQNKGLGLKNVQERLELIYNNKYDLRISKQQNIFDVNLKIKR